MSELEWAVHGVALPGDASIANLYPGSQLADAFSVRLPAGAPREPEQLARIVFAHQPRWIGALMWLRDLVMGGFGLKTSKQLKSAGMVAGARRVSIFKIYSVAASEIVLGEDDSHLDFRLSLLRRGEPGGDAATLVFATVVHCHNRLGRFYILVIAPFHRLVVRASLRSAAQAGWREVAAGS